MLALEYLEVWFGAVDGATGEDSSLNEADTQRAISSHDRLCRVPRADRVL